jgi:hypothetical protein
MALCILCFIIQNTTAQKESNFVRDVSIFFRTIGMDFLKIHPPPPGFSFCLEHYFSCSYIIFGFYSISANRCTADTWAHLDIRLQEIFCWPTKLSWVMGPATLYSFFSQPCTHASETAAVSIKPVGRRPEQLAILILLK